MTELADLVQRLATTTGASARDILDAVSALKSHDDLLPKPWSEETIARALPTIVEMAARSGTSVRAVATSTRAVAAYGRPDRGSTA